ncbi:putative quinol monooxygenase [Zymomonas mobilis]|nr:antibiotic biosynthesis monooxygenase [Zymomonas mobilis]MDX5947922.1 antibiotic biosynthesis monooxygenase [Zymomonas mobilis subsp. pomaceae]
MSCRSDRIIHVIGAAMPNKKEYKTVVAVIHALPQYDDEVEKGLSDLAIQVRAEPGNVTFMPYRNVSESHSYIVYEIYQNETAFLQHVNAHYTRAFNKMLETAAKGGKSQVLEVSDIL